MAGDTPMADTTPAAAVAAATSSKPKDQARKKDWSKDCEVEIPAARDLADEGKLGEALQRLLALEKKARLSGDSKSVVDLALVVVKLCYEQGAWKELNANIMLLCKRRAQFKQVQTKVIQESMEYIDDAPDKEAKLELIDVLRTISEGKIVVECERARLTMKLAMMKEADGDIAGAADTLQDENVETYGGMEKREKFTFMLEQIRLCMAKKDWVRTSILTNKLNRKQLEEPELEDIKIRYYGLVIEFHTHEKEPLELARAHLAIFRTKAVQAEREKWEPELQSAVLLLALSPFDNHQHDLVQKMLSKEEAKEETDMLESLPAYHALLTHLVTDEIVPWPLPEHEELAQHELLRSDSVDGVDWVAMLRDRVAQHNIRVVAKSYSQIHTARLAGFLQLSTDKTEEYIADMVTSAAIPLEAKIDRPAGIVRFSRRKDASTVLSDWSDDISSLLGLVEKTCHLISKENMIHGIK